MLIKVQLLLTRMRLLLIKKEKYNEKSKLWDEATY